MTQDTPCLDLPERIETYNREAVLFDHAAGLAERGYPESAVMAELSKENSTRCSLPFEDDVLGAIATSAVKYVENRDKPRFAHDAFGDMLIYRHHVCLLDGMLMIWDGKSYQAGQDKVIRFAVNLRPSLKTSDIKELVSYLENRAPKVAAPSSRYIAFRNGVFDLETGRIRENTPELRVPNLIPHDWNPAAECPAVDEALTQWACGREDIRTALMELIGLCMYRGREYQSGTFLTGTGANGKSTFLNMIMSILGPENTSSLDIWSFGERFQTNALAGMLANIGDDIANERLSGKALAILKKVTAGNWVSAEVKGGKTYEFRPYATCVFSCNRMPRLADNSEGVYRRFRIIPFLASFPSQSGSCNLHLERELSGEDAMQRTIFLGVQALMDAQSRGCLIQIAEQEAMIDSIRKENSSVFQFVCEELEYGTPDAESIYDHPTREIYGSYKAYCEEAGLRPVSRNNFSTEMCALYDAATKKVRIGGGNPRAVFVPNEQQAAS